MKPAHECSDGGRVVKHRAPLSKDAEMVSEGFRVEQVDYLEVPPIVNIVYWVVFCPFCGEKLG